MVSPSPFRQLQLRSVRFLDAAHIPLRGGLLGECVLRSGDAIRLASYLLRVCARSRSLGLSSRLDQSAQIVRAEIALFFRGWSFGW